MCLDKSDMLKWKTAAQLYVYIFSLKQKQQSATLR